MTTEPGGETAALHVFCIDGDEWYVAESLEDFWKEREDFTGLPRDDDYPHEVERLAPDTKISIIVNADGDPDDTGEPLELTAAEWAARQGKGMLCATDY